LPYWWYATTMEIYSVQRTLRCSGLRNAKSRRC